MTEKKRTVRYVIELIQFSDESEWHRITMEQIKNQIPQKLTKRT